MGTKYDVFESTTTKQEQEEMLASVRKYAKAMGNVPIIYTSAAKGINVIRLFKLIVSMVFGIDPKINKVTEAGNPILEYNDIQ